MRKIPWVRRFLRRRRLEPERQSQLYGNHSSNATIDLTVSAIVANGSSTSNLTKTGSSILAFTGLNTYSGSTTINAGTLNVGSLASGGSVSALGQSSNAAANLVFGGSAAGTVGILQYTGSTATSTDRLFTIGDSSGSNATLDGSGSATAGSLNFTNTGAIAFGTNVAHNLTLTGTNTVPTRLTWRLPTTASRRR